MAMNIFRFNLWKLFGFYVFSITSFAAIFWLLYSVAKPEGTGNIESTLFTSMGLKVPPELFGGEFSFILFIILGGSIFLSIALLALNMFFGAVITAKMIKPRIEILTSEKGVLSTCWDKSKKPYILVRLINANKFDLISLKVRAVITIEEHFKNDEGKDDKFIFYFPIDDEFLDPTSIFILKSSAPWTIAVPADVTMWNSIVEKYELNLGKEQKGILPGYEPYFVERKMEFLIKGFEAMSSSIFTDHEEVYIDRQVGNKYELLLHEGTFKSLDVSIDDPHDIEQYVTKDGEIIDNRTK